MALLIPELVCQTVYDIPISFFKCRGIKLLFMDIDNTLVTYDDAHPTEKNYQWFERLKQNGIEIVFLSNNKEGRVKEYAEKTEYSYYADVSKPSCKAHMKVMKEKNLSPSMCAGVGDQIFTDVLAAHRAGSAAVLVSPIKDRTDLFCRFKRLCEKPFLAHYKKCSKVER